MRFMLALVVVLVACGNSTAGGNVSAPTVTPSSAASQTRSASPSPFGTADCTSPLSGGTRTSPVNDTFQTSISVPSGWTRQDRSATDLPFSLIAPETYQYSPTVIKLSAPSPADLSLTPAAFLTRLTDGVWLDNGPMVVTASAQPCSVGSDRAAWLAFSSAQEVGYMVLWFHFNDYYLLQLNGNGGVDPRAIQDAKAVLGSVTYSHNVPPPGYSPSPAT
jgi:hypothetical protein